MDSHQKQKALLLSSVLLGFPLFLWILSLLRGPNAPQILLSTPIHRATMRGFAHAVTKVTNTNRHLNELLNSIMVRLLLFYQEILASPGLSPSNSLLAME